MTDSRIDAGPSGARPKAKTPSPWSVRGVSREARAKAAKAASRRRETLGEWVTNALTQIANEELGSGPRRAASEYGQAGLPAGPMDDDSPLGRALSALAKRFERSEKRNDANSALAQRVDIAEFQGKEFSVMAEQIGVMEHRSRALTQLVDRLETADRREKTLLFLMQSVAERAERGEERIAAITHGLADMASQLQVALNTTTARTAQNISQSMMPLEKAVSALGSKLAAQPAVARSAAPAAASPQYYGTPAENSPPLPAAMPTEAAPAGEPAAADKHVLPGETAGAEKNDGRLKFDFNALNKRAIENSRRLAQDSDSAPGGGKSGGAGWFGKKQTARESGKEAGKAREEDEMLMAIKQAIKPKNS